MGLNVPITGNEMKYWIVKFIVQNRIVHVNEIVEKTTRVYRYFLPEKKF